MKIGMYCSDSGTVVIVIVIIFHTFTLEERGGMRKSLKVFYILEHSDLI